MNKRKQKQIRQIMAAKRAEKCGQIDLHPKSWTKQPTSVGSRCAIATNRKLGKNTRRK